MGALGAFVMASRWRAVLVTAAGVMLPLLTWLSGATLALVTLRRGVRDGALVSGWSAIVVAAAAAVSHGYPQAALSPLLEIWLPVLVLASCLRVTVSLSSTLLVMAVLGGLAVVGFHLIHPDPAAFWTAQFDRMQSMVEQGGGPVPGWDEWERALAPVMTGLWAANLMLLSGVSLLLGRWWQALLYNPGGFRREFYGLRLDWRLALVALALWCAALFTEPGLIDDLGLAVGLVFVLQGLSLLHAVAAARNWSRIWLVVAYLVLPFLFQLAMAAGMMDSLFNWRRRLLGDSGDNESVR